MKKQLIIILLISMFIFTACSQIDNSEKVGITEESNSVEPTSVKEGLFKEVIIFDDENSTITITKYKTTKTAELEIEILLSENELVNEWMDLRELSANMSCGLYSLIFFDPEGLAEFEDSINAFNEMEGQVLEGDTKPVEGTPLDIVKGYDITMVKASFVDKESNNEFASCEITGKNDDDIKVKFL